MRYAIIAAGEGSRLAQEGVTQPKPLVPICGEPLLRRLVRIFMDNGAEEVAVVCNDRTPLVRNCLEQLLRDGMDGRRVPLRYVVKTTPSSMHSFHALASLLAGDEPFVLTTVDTVFREQEFADYVAALQRAADSGLDGLMGVTEYVDDEKPLYVAANADGRITAFRDTPGGCRYVSGGIYGLVPSTLHTLQRCVERGEHRMRNFQRALVSDGCRLQAWPFSKVFDVDHPSDIVKAEAFLRAEQKKTCAEQKKTCAEQEKACGEQEKTCAG